MVQRENFVGFLDIPYDNDVINPSCLILKGWAFTKSNDEITLEILIDGISVKKIQRNKKRLDVHHDYPRYSSSLNSGFEFQLDLSAFDDGEKKLEVVAIINDQRYNLSSRKIIFDKSSTTLAEHTIPPNVIKNRNELALKYISGNGIEIGALHYPLETPQNTDVKYVDFYSTQELRDRNPGLHSFNFQEVHIVDDGEKLLKIPNNSQDFIIANHFLEHTQNPILTIKNHLAKLRRNGILFYSIPDKWRSFDADRPITPFEHILQDFQHGPENSYREHLREWVVFVNKTKNDKIEESIQKLADINYSIHFHVWDEQSFKDFIKKTMPILNNSFKILEFFNNSTEHIVILQKNRLT